jgi:hypothetical protein
LTQMAQYIPLAGVEAVEAAILILRGVLAGRASAPKVCHFPAGSTAFKIHVWHGDLVHVLTVHPEYIAHSCEDPQVTRMWLTDYQFEDAMKCLSVIRSYGKIAAAACCDWPAEQAE